MLQAIVANGYVRERWVKRIVSKLVFIEPVAGFLNVHVHSTIDECRLTQLYAGTQKVDKKRIPLHRSGAFTNASKKSKKKRAARVQKLQICKKETGKSLIAAFPIAEKMEVE